MIELMLDSLPLSALPKLPVWPARSIAEGNALYALMHTLHGPMRDYSATITPDNPPQGFSIAARRPVTFNVQADGDGKINFRESVFCPVTRLNARMRIAWHLFLTLFERPEDCDLYIPEHNSPTYEFIASQTGRVCGSEHLPGVALGSRNHLGVRSEDPTALTFGDARFDAVMMLGKLEYTPDYMAMLRECRRVLRPGGKLILSTSFQWQPDHLVRAVRSKAGKVDQLEPPIIANDPNHPEGKLCYYWFGWRLLEDLRIAGFAEAKVMLTNSREFGYLGDPQSYFVATK